MKGGDLAGVRAILVNEAHGYGDFLNKADLDDIAIFVVKGQVAMDEYIDPGVGYSKGHAPGGNVHYQTICANCHGNDGQQIADGPPLGELGRTNPWRALHTLMNGHPNGNMPALRVVGMPLLLDMLSYVQGLPRRDLLTSVARGGRLYDTWYKENGTAPPRTPHPAYPGTLANVEPRTTWRCKECHGWDYGGVTTASGSAPGLRALAGKPVKTIQARLRDKTHGFGSMLSERDFSDLANFIAEGLTDMDAYIERTTRKAKSHGDAYAAHYQTVCASCHGVDGREIRTQPSLGRVANAEPWRALHSIINGHAGEAMPALVAFPRDMAGGILAYIQNLPQHR
jgi:mono/diheme cytochrome c family protein